MPVLDGEILLNINLLVAVVGCKGSDCLTYCGLNQELAMMFWNRVKKRNFSVS